jgi:hypothetical protein
MVQISRLNFMFTILKHVLNQCHCFKIWLNVIPYQYFPMKCTQTYIGINYQHWSHIHF